MVLWEKTVRFCYKSIFYKDLHSHFYNSCAVIWWTRDLEFLKARRQDVAPLLLLLPCVYLKKQQYQKNGEKQLCFDSFTLLSLTFFQWNCHFWGECAIHGIAATDQCSPHRHCCPPVFIKTERGGKKNGETTSYALIILHFFHSPFFHINCHILGECERSIISQPTDRCSPCCH